jgi:serine/threonine-protein kinase
MSAVTQQIPSVEDKISDKNEDYDDDDYYYDDEDEKEIGVNKKKIIKIAIGVSLVLLLLVLGVGAYKMFSSSSTGSNEVKVPNLVGMKEDDAKTELNKLNLVLVEGGSEVSDQPEGTVIKMKDQPGTMVKEKSEIRVIISKGGKKNLMPDLVDYDIDRAKTILDSLGLKISDQSEAFSDSVPKGQIISQTPKKDTEVSASDNITVVVSKGPEVKYTTVPSVKGLSAADAKSKLENAGVTVSQNYQTTQNESENGIVLSQDSEGSKVKQGSTVNITVGSYVQKQAPPVTSTPGTTNPAGTDNTTPSNGTQSPGSNTATQGPGASTGTTGPTATSGTDKTNTQNNTSQNKSTSQNR